MATQFLLPRLRRVPDRRVRLREGQCPLRRRPAWETTLAWGESCRQRRISRQRYSHHRRIPTRPRRLCRACQNDFISRRRCHSGKPSSVFLCEFLHLELRAKEKDKAKEVLSPGLPSFSFSAFSLFSLLIHFACFSSFTSHTATACYYFCTGFILFTQSDLSTSLSRLNLFFIPRTNKFKMSESSLFAEMSGFP